MPAFNASMESGVEDPVMPGEEESSSSFAVGTLAQALGFINEFNHNVAIFEPIATVFVMAVVQLINTNGAVRRNSSDIVKIHRDISLLRQMINNRAEADYEARARAQRDSGYTGVTRR